jgi:GNAT superfamily N-acetyltransferase
MNPITLQPFQSMDYDELIQLETRVWPGEPLSKEGLEYDDQTWDARYFYQRHWIEQDGRRIGIVQASQTPWAYEPDKYFIKILIDPAEQGRGYGRWAYDQVIGSLGQRGARLLTTTTRADQDRAIRFLADRGFVEVIREFESRLEVADFDPDEFADALAQVKAQKIKIQTIRALQTEDPAWLEKWYHLFWQIMDDIPTSEAFTQGTIAEFEQGLASPQIDLDAVYIAIDPQVGQWVGLSSLLRYPEDETTLYVRTTGVLRSHRRRGIALALKVHTIVYAQTIDAEQIISENMPNNPMYHLNQKLGFEYRHAWIGYERRIT